MLHSAIEEFKKFGSIFLGAIGHPDVKPGILEVGILLKTRFALDQYINLQPVKLYPNVETPPAAPSIPKASPCSSPWAAAHPPAWPCTRFSKRPICTHHMLRKKHQFGHQHRAGRMAAGFDVRKIALREAKEILNALLLHGSRKVSPRFSHEFAKMSGLDHGASGSKAPR